MSNQASANPPTTLAVTRARYAEMANDLCPMTDAEAAYISALFEKYMDQGSCTRRHAVNKVCEFLAVPPPEIPEELEKVALETFIKMRREDLKSRTFRQQLRDTFLALSADGSTLDYDTMLEGLMEDDEADAPPAGALNPENDTLAMSNPENYKLAMSDPGKQFMREQARKAKLEETEKILLHAFLYGNFPTDADENFAIRRPADAKGKPLPLSMPIDTFLKNYFADK